MLFHHGQRAVEEDSEFYIEAWFPFSFCSPIT